MTVTYNLGSPPFWFEKYPSTYGANLSGQPIVGGLIYTYLSSNHSSPQPTYSSNQGTPPAANTNPIVLDADGKAIIYWNFDDQNPQILYYFEVHDPQGNLIYSRDFYDGSPVPTTVVSSQSGNLINYIRNPQMSFYHYGYAIGDTKQLKYQTAECYLADEWYFQKSNTTATDTFQVVYFGSGQSVPDNSPRGYGYFTTTGGTSETFKYFYQKLPGVANFSGQTMAIQMALNSPLSSSVNISLVQNFGTGGSPSSSVTTVVINAQSLTTVFVNYQYLVTLPVVTGKTFGTNDDDALWLVISPNSLTVAMSFQITNVSLQNAINGNIPAYSFDTYSNQRALLDYNVYGWPTGSRRSGYIATPPAGWLLLDDLTIGNANSSATSNSGAGASENSRALFYHLWNGVSSPTSNSFCAVSGGLGASAQADFDANKTMTLPITMGRAFGNAGSGSGLTARVAGANYGSEVIGTANLPAHSHTFGSAADSVAATATANFNYYASQAGSASPNFPGSSSAWIGLTATDTTGSATHFIGPTTFEYEFIKL